MNVKGIIFDYGGTLDTGGHHWARIFWQAYQQARVPVTEQQFREAYVYGERTLGHTPIIQPSFTFLQTLEAKIGLQFQWLSTQQPPGAQHLLRRQSSPIASLQQQVVALSYAHAQRATSHSREVLASLAPHYPMVLVSNFYGNISVVLNEFGLDEFFPTVVESAVVGIRKPDSRIFSLGVRALGLKPEQVVVVGDSIDKDIIPAREAGCQTVWIKGMGWTYETPDGSCAGHVITDLAQLQPLLLVTT